jgi:hypothetical protein
VNFPNNGASFGFNGVDIPKTLTDLAATNNANVAALERSIRDSAHLTLRLNLFSGFMSILGLIAQIRVYHQDTRKDGDRNAGVQRDSEPGPVREDTEFCQETAEQDDGHTAD